MHSLIIYTDLIEYNIVGYVKTLQGKFTLFDKKLSKSSEFYYLESGLDSFFTDSAEAMNILLQEKHTHKENCIKVKMSRRAQKVEN